MIRAMTAAAPRKRNPARGKPTEGQRTPQKAVSVASTANLMRLVGTVVRVYVRGKRSISDGYHCGKLLSVSKGKAVIELRHKTVVSASDVEGM